MDITAIIYSPSDPCIDGFYAPGRNHVAFGARRVQGAELKIGLITNSFCPFPADDELGVAILNELAQTGNPLPAGPHAPSGINDRGLNLAIDESYWRFCFWTKVDAAIPYIIGAPLSPRYPDSMDRRPLAKPASAPEIGAALRLFLHELKNYLQQSG